MQKATIKFYLNMKEIKDIEEGAFNSDKSKIRFISTNENKHLFNLDFPKNPLTKNIILEENQIITYHNDDIFNNARVESIKKIEDKYEIIIGKL